LNNNFEAAIDACKKALNQLPKDGYPLMVLHWELSYFCMQFIANRNPLGCYKSVQVKYHHFKKYNGKAPNLMYAQYNINFLLVLAEMSFREDKTQSMAYYKEAVQYVNSRIHADPRLQYSLNEVNIMGEYLGF
jgi:tetratricopeptide (TPR) repeat protein